MRQPNKYLTLLSFGITLLAVGAGANAGLLFEQPGRPSPQPDAGRVPVVGEAAKAFPHRRRLDLDSFVTPQITQAGSAPLELPAIRGAARGVDFMEVMRQIVPHGWRVFIEGDVDPSLRLDWTGNRNWVQVLNSVLIDSRMKAYIDWSNNELTLIAGVKAPVDVEPLPPLVVTSEPAKDGGSKPITKSEAMALFEKLRSHQQDHKAVQNSELRAASLAPEEEILTKSEFERLVKEARASDGGKAAAESKVAENASASESGLQKTKKIPAAAPVPAPAPALGPTKTASKTPNIETPAVASAKKGDVAAQAERTWTMSKDMTLRKNLEAWAEADGWRLVWSAREGDHIFDYPSDPFIGYQFKGELMGSTGVMARVISTFVDSEPPLAIEFFRANSVVEVSLYKPAKRTSLPSALENEINTVRASGTPAK